MKVTTVASTCEISVVNQDDQKLECKKIWNKFFKKIIIYICPESNLTFLAYVHKDICILVSRDTHKLIDMCISIVIDRYTNIHNIFE